MAPEICVIRGGGDLATGVAWRLSKAGFGLVVTELANPLTVRRSVALSSAVSDGVVDIEGLIGQRVESSAEALDVATRGEVAVMVSPEIPNVGAKVIVDARMAKRNIDTSIDDASFVVALGPGFTAGLDCHAVIETMRGSRLGRVIWNGQAIANTGSPGLVSGRGKERVLRAAEQGIVSWNCSIGDQVREGQKLGRVGSEDVIAPFDGVVRGLIKDGLRATHGLKVGDIDPRMDVSCNEISDKALAIGGGVTEAALTWQNQSR